MTTKKRKVGKKSKKSTKKSTIRKRTTTKKATAVTPITSMLTNTPTDDYENCGVVGGFDCGERN